MRDHMERHTDFHDHIANGAAGQIIQGFLSQFMCLFTFQLLLTGCRDFIFNESFNCNGVSLENARLIP